MEDNSHALNCTAFRDSRGGLTPPVRRRLLHGLEDADIPSAAAQIAGQPLLDLRQRGLRVPFEQVVGGEDHARRADAALRSATLEEALLDGMELLPLFHAAGQSFDGSDL